jgi:hypothetical protein
MMPYTFGLDFERTVLTQKGTAGAYLGALEHPPVDTLQIMEPQTYLDNKAAQLPTIPDLDKLIAPDFQRYDFGGMGAYDIFLLVRQYAPEADPKKYYPHWRGGYYLAAHSKTTPKDDIALLYFSRWDSQEAAKEFAKLYSDYTPTRYNVANASTVRPSVEGDSEGNIRYRWDFGSQGKVVIDVHGNDLLVMEEFNDDTARRITAAVLPSAQPVN